MKRVVVLGSTGSIGRQTLDVAKRLGSKIEIVGLAAGRDAAALVDQRKDFPKAKLALFHPSSGYDIPTGMEAIVELATGRDVDCVVVSVAGVIGLLPTIRSIEAGKDIALASKEVLVAGGEIVMPLVRKQGVTLTPIDSEHSAVFQCLEGRSIESVDRIFLTASGGPFRGWSLERLKDVSVEQAMNHPTWRMGGKITVDSANLMNKALELIEAKWLFGVAMDQVEIVVHPQSIVHSFVRLKDGSMLGQLGLPDMRIPIQFALTYPDRVDTGLASWNPLASDSLDFEPYATEVFIGPNLARHAEKLGGTAPCAFNAANEEAANAFLRGEIGFLDIQSTVEHIVQSHRPEPASLETLLSIDTMVREQARAHFASFVR